MIDEKTNGSAQEDQVTENAKLLQLLGDMSECISSRGCQSCKYGTYMIFAPLGECTKHLVCTKHMAERLAEMVQTYKERDAKGEDPETKRDTDQTPSTEDVTGHIDNVNHPSHYTYGRVEVIDVIEDACGDTFSGFLLGNILKYLLRHEHKGGVEDLRKARCYLDRLIESKQGSQGKAGKTEGEA